MKPIFLIGLAHRQGNWLGLDHCGIGSHIQPITWHELIIGGGIPLLDNRQQVDPKLLSHWIGDRGRANQPDLSLLYSHFHQTTRVAQRINAAKSTGPKSVEGKEAARRNELKHGLTEGGVVISGEDEHEVAIRVAALEGQLVPEGDVISGLLVRQVAISSIRIERAFRNETALAAERMRRAGDIYAEERLTLAQTILGEISRDPVTVRRRLLAAPEGIDAMIVRLRALREQTDTSRIVLWDVPEGEELDQLLGKKPGLVPLSRVEMLTKGVVYDHWVGIDPAEFEGMQFEPRLLWAVAQLKGIIDAEIKNLEAIQSNLDTTRRDRGQAEAGDRALLDLGKEGTAFRRYAGAAERTMLKVLQEMRLARAEAKEREVTPAATVEVLQADLAESAARSEVRDESGSFCTETRDVSQPDPWAKLESSSADPNVSFAPVTIGRTPGRPGGPRL